MEEKGPTTNGVSTPSQDDNKPPLHSILRHPGGPRHSIPVSHVRHSLPVSHLPPNNHENHFESQFENPQSFTEQNTPRVSIHETNRLPRSSSRRSFSIRSLSNWSLNNISRQSIMRIGDIEGHAGSRPYNILTDFFIFGVTTVEITVVIILAVDHFLHASGLLAVTMLLPLLLNCVGVIYFLSDKIERLELERSIRVKCFTDVLQLPVLGPLFTTLKVLMISCGCSSYQNYERMEAIAVKLRQAGGFFSAAPESLVILTVLLSIQIEYPDDIFAIQYLEMGAVLFFVFTLAESNCYGTLSPYYKMFTHKETSSTWRLDHVHLWQKLLVFLHSFTSIGSRMIAMAGIKAAALYMWQEKDFPLVVVVVVFGEMGVRVVVHYILRQLKFLVRDHEIPSSCYESLNYAWRSSILNYGFQSQNLFVQWGFYMENVICFGGWVFCALCYGPTWVGEKLLLPVSVLFTSMTVVSIALLVACTCFKLVKLHGPCRATHEELSDEMKIRIIHEFVRNTSIIPE